MKNSVDKRHCGEAIAERHYYGFLQDRDQEKGHEHPIFQKKILEFTKKS